MKNLVYGESSWLVGDEAADAVLEYAVLMAKHGTADTLDVAVLGPDGNAETTTLVLGPSTMIQAQTTRSELVEPDNSALLAHVGERLHAAAQPAQPLAVPPGDDTVYDEVI